MPDNQKKSKPICESYIWRYVATEKLPGVHSWDLFLSVISVLFSKIQKTMTLRSQ